MAALVLALVACRSGPGPAPTLPPPSPTPTAKPAPTVPAPQASPTPGLSQMTLYIWVSPDFAFAAHPDGALLQGFTDAYPGLRAQVSVKEVFGKGGMVHLLSGASAVAPSYLPDLILAADETLEQIAALGLSQPVDVLLPSVRESLFANLQVAAPGDAARLGVPFAMDFPLLAYRTPMTLPLSWDSIAASGGRYAFAAGDEDSAAQALLIQYLGLGGALVDAEGRLSLDSRLLIRALETYRGLADQGVFASQVASVDKADEVWAMFRAGEANFAEVRASLVRGHAAALTDTALSAIPTVNGQPLTLARTWSWAIVASTPERQQAAARFVEWVLGPAQQSAWCEGAGLVPTQPSAWPLARLSATDSAILLDLAQVAIPCPAASRTPAVSSALHTALTQVLKGQLAPRQAAEQALTKIRQQ
ncbi:MAG: extracellular solute-binding protein [Anaerolineae bacterium]|nr:extracellular solute-binding protein [Anaerolineae bacterium]